MAPARLLMCAVLCWAENSVDLVRKLRLLFMTTSLRKNKYDGLVQASFIPPNSHPFLKCFLYFGSLVTEISGLFKVTEC